MSWELQQHMHEYIPPSIQKALENNLLDHVIKDEGLEAFTISTKVNHLTEMAVKESCTTNGGHEFYIDDWNHIPWCDDEEMTDYWSF